MARGDGGGAGNVDSSQASDLNPYALCDSPTPSTLDPVQSYKRQNIDAIMSIDLTHPSRLEHPPPLHPPVLCPVQSLERQNMDAIMSINLTHLSRLAHPPPPSPLLLYSVQSFMREDIDAIMSIDLVRKKAFRKRAVARLRWTLVDGTTIAVQVRQQGQGQGSRWEGKRAVEARAGYRCHVV